MYAIILGGGGGGGGEKPTSTLSTSQRNFKSGQKKVDKVDVGSPPPLLDFTIYNRIYAVQRSFILLYIHIYIFGIDIATQQLHTTQLIIIRKVGSQG